MRNTLFIFVTEHKVPNSGNKLLCSFWSQVPANFSRSQPGDHWRSSPKKRLLMLIAVSLAHFRSSRTNPVNTRTKNTKSRCLYGFDWEGGKVTVCRNRGKQLIAPKKLNLMLSPCSEMCKLEHPPPAGR